MTTAVSSEHAGKVMPWWVILLQGIFLLVIGGLLLAAPAKSAVILWQLIGIYWFIKGIFAIVTIFIDSTAWGWKLLVGIIGIIAGLFLIQHPIRGAIVGFASLALLVGIQGIVIGLVELIEGFRGGGLGPILLGILSIVLGIWVLANWQAVSFALPWVVAIFALVGGVLAIILSFRVKSQTG